MIRVQVYEDENAELRKMLNTQLALVGSLEQEIAKRDRLIAELRKELKAVQNEREGCTCKYGARFGVFPLV